MAFCKYEGMQIPFGSRMGRRIYSLGLISEFKNKDFDVGRTLKHIFGLPYLPPSKILNCFTEYLMAIKPKTYQLFELCNMCLTKCFFINFINFIVSLFIIFILLFHILYLISNNLNNCIICT